MAKKFRYLIKEGSILGDRATALEVSEEDFYDSLNRSMDREEDLYNDEEERHDGMTLGELYYFNKALYKSFKEQDNTCGIADGYLYIKELVKEEGEDE